MPTWNRPGVLEGGDGRPMTERLTIVLPVSGDYAGTLACLESLEACTGATPFELLVVDHGASPEVRRLLDCLEGDVRVVAADQGLRAVEAAAAGAAHAATELVAFLDTSSSVGAGWP